MSVPLILHPDRLFPADSQLRAIARSLYVEVVDLPIVSPHGHTDPAWFATNRHFSNPTELLIVPDHYLLRMLYSQGVPLDSVGLLPGGEPVDETISRGAWSTFARNYRLFRGTPSRLWLDHVFAEVFEIDTRLDESTADHYYDKISAQLVDERFRPRQLFDRFQIEVLATTESPLDDLRWHRAIRDSGWGGNVVSTYRPDPVIDPDYEGFADNVRILGDVARENTESWDGYLEAHRKRRAYFKELGATATDHGHPSATTADLTSNEAAKLFDRVLCGKFSAADAELFRGQMLMEMARMSVEDGLVMQIHPGSSRNHNRLVFERFGRDKGADIPVRTDYVGALKPLLDRFGNESRLSIILFTLDESTYSRELAPLAGHYPVLKLGPPWWFHDSPEGMRRFRERVTETAGFYNTAGFNDDTRAFLSIPARHDLARRMDCAFLAQLLGEHRIELDEAREVAVDLAYGLVKTVYKFS